MFDSPGLVDFAIGLVIFVLNLPDGQMLFFGEIQLQKDSNQFCYSKRVLGLVEMTCGLVHADSWEVSNLPLSYSDTHGKREDIYEVLGINNQVVCLQPFGILNPVMFDYIWITICFSYLLGPTSISAINTAKGK